jgi:hypothetical protein
MVAGILLVVAQKGVRQVVFAGSNRRVVSESGTVPAAQDLPAPPLLHVTAAEKLLLLLLRIRDMLLLVADTTAVAGVAFDRDQRQKQQPYQL